MRIPEILSLTHLVVKESAEPDEEDLEDAGLEQGDLVVVVEALEAGHQLGEVAHLADVVHEALAKVLQEGVLGPALHRASLQGKRIVSSPLFNRAISEGNMRLLAAS